MLKSIQINNFKSIDALGFDPGRVNVFIGENGAGKSNIVEAIGFAAAAQANKLDSEFLTSRGIRTVDPVWMKSGFKGKNSKPIEIILTGRNNVTTAYELNNDGKPYSTWSRNISLDMTKMSNFESDFESRFSKTMSSLSLEKRLEFLNSLRSIIKIAAEQMSDEQNLSDGGIHSLTMNDEFSTYFADLFPPVDDNLKDFVIYSPENSSLRVFEKEGQVEPLGVNGEGLLKLLSVMNQNAEDGRLNQVKDALQMLGWFADFSVVQGKSRTRMDIRDRYISSQRRMFDQSSANEGFLFIAFYFALFSSDVTPKIFAIDNIDASLNPKLCQAMMERLVELAVKNNKQVILTTHNPAILDGLDLNDDEQRLFIVRRSSEGQTRATRYEKPLSRSSSRKMSDMFLSGLIGGLPKSF